ncbi:MAG TPA: hypothetical protein VLH10_14665 [Yinghuangia sp.]|uniref:hypothetical protein n=1 Tax=Yinghuangia sp. YIM S10712 TaxID=3436930 RepID=UPI002B81F027|nr:hypothetical protein [Yinghuangia sp.]
MTVAVDPERFAEVVKALRGAGLNVEEEYAAIAAVVGGIAEEGVRGLADIPGVEAVDVEREFRLPPPDSPLQ